MKRHLTVCAMTGVLALSGIAAGATPARASDYGTYIAGAAALAIIGSAISGSTRHDGGRRGSRRGGSHLDGGHTGDRRNGSRRNEYRFATPAALPAACRVYSGQGSGYSGNCLNGNYAGYEALPAACEVYIGGHHGTIYRDGCLDRYGYSAGRR